MPALPCIVNGMTATTVQVHAWLAQENNLAG
jgi:hypothetical protein